MSATGTVPLTQVAREIGVSRGTRYAHLPAVKTVIKITAGGKSLVPGLRQGVTFGYDDDRALRPDDDGHDHPDDRGRRRRL